MLLIGLLNPLQFSWRVFSEVGPCDVIDGSDVVYNVAINRTCPDKFDQYQP